MTTQTGTPQPDPGTPAKPEHVLDCPWCRYSIATPDAGVCPECGRALRLGYINGWTVQSERWLKRLSLCSLALAVLHLGASLVWPVVEVGYWYSWTHFGDEGWFTDFVVMFLEAWAALHIYWPMFIGLVLSPLLLIAVLLGSFRNLRLVSSKREPEPTATDRAWRRVFVMLLLIASVTAVQLISLLVQYIRS